MKIIEALDLVMKYAREDAVVLIDRGADCNVLYDSFLQSGYPFIIRQNGNRHLLHSENKLPFKDISRRKRLWTALENRGSASPDKRRLSVRIHLPATL